MKRYYFKYKVFDVPYFYEFTCIAKNEMDARRLFVLNVDDVEEYRLAHVENL